MSSPPSGGASSGPPVGADALAADPPTPPTGSRPLPEPTARRSGGLLPDVPPRPVPSGRIPGQQGGPVTGGPVTGGPVTGGPVTGGPVTGGPVTGGPVTGGPVTGSPVTGSPVTGSPVTGSPVTGSPVTGSPVTGTAAAVSLWRRLWPFRRPALSSAVAALALAGSGVLILRLVQRQTGTTGLLVGLGLALLPLPFVLGALAWLNQTARVPLRHLLFCLAWGACAATTMAILANGWASDFLIAHQGARGETLGAEFATPLIEELAKGAALLVLLLPLRRRHRCEQGRPCAGWRRLLWHWPGPGRPAHFRPAPAGRQRARSSPRTLAAGTVLGGVTACGFAFTENALYLGRAFTADRQARLDAIGQGGAPSLRDFDGTVHTFVLRALLSPFAHPLFTALTGLGLAITLTTGRRWLARLGAPAGALLAMGLHGVWNAAAGLGTDGFLLVYGLVMVPCFAALVSFAVWAQTRRTRQPSRPG